MMMMASALPASMEGLPAGYGSGENQTMTNSGFSITDITLEQAIVKIKEIEGENRAHRDNLREQNARMKEQCEYLERWRSKEHERTVQTKELITSLRRENQGLLVKILTLEDKEKTNTAEHDRLVQEKAQLQQQKQLSDLRVLNILKHARDQGVQGLNDTEDENSWESQSDPETIVYVSTCEKEGEIEKLEASLARKDETISELRAAKIKSEQEVKILRETTQQLLKDMQNQQSLKDTIQAESRNTQKLLEEEKQRHQQMQTIIARTKREIQVPGKQEARLSALVSEIESDTAMSAVEATAPRNVSYPESPDDVMNIIQSLDAEKQQEHARKELEKRVEVEKQAKQELQKEVHKLTSQVEELQLALEKEKLNASNEMEALIQQYENKFVEMAEQRKQREIEFNQQKPDESILRSQNLALIHQLDDAESQKSELLARNNGLKERLQEVEETKRSLLSERAVLWQEKNCLIQDRRTQQEQQLRSQQETNLMRVQHMQRENAYLQRFQDLEQAFTAYRQGIEKNMAEKGMSRQTTDEINRLTAQVIAAEEALADKDKKLAELRKHEEDVQILRALAAEYQSDFQIERDARTKLGADRNRLMEELDALREQYRQLKEESEIFNQQQIRTMQARYQEHPEEQPAASQEIECPFCDAKLPNSYAAQVHANECLDKKL